MKYLDIDLEELKQNGASYTAKEIAEQPLVWQSTYEKLLKEKAELAAFWDMAKGKGKKIILTGAGTSAYIGYSLEGSFQRHTGIATVSVSTTHLVTHPGDYLQKEEPTILVSFARSGNSPESVAAVKLADKICDTCYHLVITCDANGQLAKYESSRDKLNFVLPPESNDKSLAMTSSYSAMMLSGLLLSRFSSIDGLAGQVASLIACGNNIINAYTPKLAEMAKLDFNRAVFLGSGPLYGTAMEGHLKLQELTDGQVICKNDSFLGFRHGPKAVVDDKTLVMFNFSNVKSVQKYEFDLVKAMQKENKAMYMVGVSESPINDFELDANLVMSKDGILMEEEFLPICAILPAQILGFYKSIECGLMPDSPSVSGTISRVVQGVVIYDEVL